MIFFVGKGLISREGEDIGLYITLVPKVLKTCYLIHWLKMGPSDVQTIIYRRGNFVYLHLGYVHQFINHCLIL